MKSLTVGIVVLLVLFGVLRYRTFNSNLQAAKASGLKYIIVPVWSFHWSIVLTHRILVPLLRAYLPERWTKPWLDFVSTEWGWEQLYRPFESLGVDTFIIVTPWGNAVHTADPDVIVQITTRRSDFPKPTHLYKPMDIYGKNMLSTEGHTWKRQRNILGHSFSGRNNSLVWSESLQQAKQMTHGWLEAERETSQTLYSFQNDTMRFSLHVISSAGFGRRLPWSKSEYDTSSLSAPHKTAAMPLKQYLMSYTDALETLIQMVTLVMLVPRWALRILPFRSTNLASTAYSQWGLHVNEMFEEKKASILAGETPETKGMDLMASLVKGTGVIPLQNLRTTSPSPISSTLTKAEVISNVFVLILAGHETTANAIFFACLFLATSISSQRQLQAELDEIFQTKDVSEWSFEHDHPRLCGGMALSVLNEVLRLIPPVYLIPKHVTPGPTKSLTVEGKECSLPGETLILLDAAAVHRNPKHWPSAPSDRTGPQSGSPSKDDNDLDVFKPERWLPGPGEAPNGSKRKDTRSPNRDLKTSKLFMPPKGAFIPFSEGHRSCLGRHFAQVEFLAVLAVIFKTYSLELVVDEWANDEEVEKMTALEKAALYDNAKEKVNFLIRNEMSTIITNQIRKPVVLRICNRGGERF